MQPSERSVFGIDLLLIGATLCLVTFGVLFIFSSGATPEGSSLSSEWIKQIVWGALGLGLLTAASLLDYTRLRDTSRYVYAALLVTLVITLFAGRVVNGARAWLGIGEFGVQPSEFMKVATILLLATYLERQGPSIAKPLPFLGAALIVLVPVALILLQPDLGTALVYIPIFLVMTFAAGARISYLAFIVLTGGLTVVLAVLPAWQEMIHQQPVALVSVLTDTRLLVIVAAAVLAVGGIGALGVYVLKRPQFRLVIFGSLVTACSLAASFVGRRVLMGYQLMRLIVFLDPNVDPRGAGWNIIQSVTAVGSGGITGKGWLQGTQSQYRYLPQQSTDFIFSILAEEWGFLGAMGVFVCFAVILGRALVIGAKSRDNFAALICMGIAGMFFFHVAVNIGMAIGVMPITGIPLILMSYGGSSLWTTMVSIGLLMSIYGRRYSY